MNILSSSSIPRQFCWTRFGTESGETIDQILQRKEQERAANNGCFLWGIGNALGPSIRQLLEHEVSPEVIFSPISSKPKREDVTPTMLDLWMAGETLSGNVVKLPEQSIVVSRGSISPRKRAHYALVCSSIEPLKIKSDNDKISLGRIQNLLSGKRVGASQVTAIVKYTKSQVFPTSKEYPVALRAKLVEPYFLKLVSPVAVDSSKCTKDYSFKKPLMECWEKTMFGMYQATGT